jgi:hypothetical protein
LWTTDPLTTRPPFLQTTQAAAGGEFGFVCKLDTGLEPPPRYFETLMARMEDNPPIGTTFGKL